MLQPYSAKFSSNKKSLTESDPIKELERLVESEQYREALLGPAAKEMSPEDEKAFAQFALNLEKYAMNIESYLGKIPGMSQLGKANLGALLQPISSIQIMARLALQYPSVLAKGLIMSNNFNTQMRKLDAKYPSPAEDKSIAAALGKVKAAATKKFSAVKGMASQLSKVIKAGAKGAVQGAVQGAKAGAASAAAPAPAATGAAPAAAGAAPAK